MFKGLYKRFNVTDTSYSDNSKTKRYNSYTKSTESCVKEYLSNISDYFNRRSFSVSDLNTLTWIAKNVKRWKFEDFEYIYITITDKTSVHYTNKVIGVETRFNKVDYYTMKKLIQKDL